MSSLETEHFPNTVETNPVVAVKNASSVQKYTQNTFKNLSTKSSVLKTKTLVKEFLLTANYPNTKCMNNKIQPKPSCSILHPKTNHLETSVDCVPVQTTVQTGQNTYNLARNVSEDNSKRAYCEESLALNQTFEQFKKLSTKKSEIAVSDKTVLEYSQNKTKISSPKSMAEVSKTKEKNQTLGVAHKGIKGQLVNTNLPATTKGKTPNGEARRVLLTVPEMKKQITVIIPPNLYRTSSKSILSSNFQSDKCSTNKEAWTSLFSVLKPTERVCLQVQSDQALNQNTQVLDPQKTVPHTVEFLGLQETLPYVTMKSPSNVTSSLELHKAVSKSPTEKLVLNRTEVPNTAVSNVSKPMEEHQVHKFIENNKSSPPINKVHSKCNNLYGKSDIPLQNVSPSETFLDQDVLLSKQVNFTDNSQHQNCKPNLTERETVISNSSNQSTSNQSSTFEKLSSVNVEQNNYTKSNNTGTMWSADYSCLTENVDKLVLLCAFKDMEICRKEDDDGNIPLQKAILDNDKNALKRQCIILKTIDLEYLNHQNKQLDTPLLLAVKCKHEDFVATLLYYGANQNIVDKDGNTALHIAVSFALLVCTRLLLAAERTLDVINSFNDEGFAPIHLAAMGGYHEIVRVLIREGAEIDKKDAKSGRTAYHHAIVLKKQDVVNVLQGLGCNTSEADFSGHLPLFEESIIVQQNTVQMKHATFAGENNKSRSENITDINNAKQVFSSNRSGSNSLNQTNIQRKSNSIISSVNDRDATKCIRTPRKKRRIRNRDDRSCEVLTLSSGDSDDDCFVVNTFRNRIAECNSKNYTQFVPAKKRRRRKVRDVLCISDDESDSDCTFIDNPVSEVNSYITGVSVVNPCSNVPLSSQNRDIHTAHSPNLNLQQNEEEMFEGFSSDDDRSEMQLLIMETVIKKFIENSQVF